MAKVREKELRILDIQKFAKGLKITNLLQKFCYFSMIMKKLKNY
jgi:hypothetical protein